MQPHSLAGQASGESQSFKKETQMVSLCHKNTASFYWGSHRGLRGSLGSSQPRRQATSRQMTLKGRDEQQTAQSSKEATGQGLCAFPLDPLKNYLKAGGREKNHSLHPICAGWLWDTKGNSKVAFCSTWERFRSKTARKEPMAVLPQFSRLAAAWAIIPCELSAPRLRKPVADTSSRKLGEDRKTPRKN